MSQNKTNQAPEKDVEVNTEAPKAEPERKTKKAEKKKSAELDKALEELAQAKDMLLRTAAEFDNYKRRTEKEKTELSEFVKASTVKQLLPIADNIARAAQAH